MSKRPSISLLAVVTLTMSTTWLACGDDGTDDADEEPPNEGGDEGEEALNVPPHDCDAGGGGQEDCGDNAESGGEEGEGEVAGPDLLEGTTPAAFHVRPGVEIASVIGAEAAEPLTLYDGAGNKLVTIVSDDAGQAHFAYIPAEHLTLQSGEGTTIPLGDGHTLKAGDGYVIRNDTVDPPTASGLFSVMDRDDPPDPEFYDNQPLDGVHVGLGGLLRGEDVEDGFGYIEVRDGVTLSVMVRFPDPALYGDGPWPTVVEYSGYSPSRPSNSSSGSLIAGLIGYASVGVNMRGTGCSGGVFDVFNPAQHADGYDMVEAIARQPWVLHNKVGLVGLSYSGITQLYVASTKPPSLAAITPQSVIGDAWEMQWPGGIYNSGFTEQWVDNRESQARAGGDSWFQKRVGEGDLRCEANLALRSQNVDFEPFLRGLEFFPPDGLDRSLPVLVRDIDVPVYLTGAFQDEQTGPYFTGMLDHFDSAPLTRFTLYNGRHPDGFSPLVISRWFEFLDLFVARRVPHLSPLVRNGAGAEFGRAFGVNNMSLEPDRFADIDPDDYEGALALYDADPNVRVLFENGAGNDTPGAPIARFEAAFEVWPPADVKPRTWFLDAGGALADEPAPDADGAGVDSYHHDGESGGTTFFGDRGYELMKPLWDLNWTVFEAGNGLSYVTAPLAEDIVLGGPGYASLWIRATHPDGVPTDGNIQVTVTEVRPDDTEVLLQSGRLRFGHRKLDAEGTEGLRTGRTYRVEDYEPLPASGEFVQVRVAIPSVAHPLRAGTRLRVLIGVPGRDHGTWEFDNPWYLPADADSDIPPSYEIVRGAGHPSSLTLGYLESVDIPESERDHSPCPSLRGQPCRDYEPIENTQVD